jgi:hypothetical protein
MTVMYFPVMQLTVAVKTVVKILMILDLVGEIIRPPQKDNSQ